MLSHSKSPARSGVKYAVCGFSRKWSPKPHYSEKEMSVVVLHVISFKEADKMS